MTKEGAVMSKEWVGESGYCNCLLVVMARAYVDTVKLSTSEPVPNLEQLAFRKSDTLEWVKAQGFDYAALDPARVIQTLIDSSNVSRPLFGFGPKKYELAVAVAEGTHGPTVPRIYELKIDRSKGKTELTISFQTREE